MNTSRTTSFDGWVLHAEVGELIKDGQKTRLQQRPLLVLEELLASPGQLVTREQLIARLWPHGVVDFDTGLNTAVRKLRVALDDVGESPRYIETLPRKGYRFIGVIDPPPSPPAPAAPGIAAPVREPVAPAPALPVTPPPPAPEAASTPSLRVSAGRTVAGRPGLPVALAGVVAIALALVGLRYARLHDSAGATPTTTRAQVTSEVGHTIAMLPLAAADSEADEIPAKIVGDALRHRVGKLASVTLIDANAIARSELNAAKLSELAASLNAGLLLDGQVRREQDTLQVDLALVDVHSGARQRFFQDRRPMSDIAGIVDEAARRLARQLRAVPASSEATASAPVDFEAYDTYLRAQALMQNQRIADAQSALELFRRATVLDPRFARAYVGMAQAQLLTTSFGDSSPAQQQEAEREVMVALDRALALDPGLGEALIERARLTADAAEADKLFREGLRLSPNYGSGYQRYAEFLFDEYRRGEALDVIERANAIDPLDPRLMIRLAMFRYFVDSDAAAHDRLVQKALAINPRQVMGLNQLGLSRYLNSGNFAEGIRLLEQAIQTDPNSNWLKNHVAAMYLDVEDPDAAMAVLAQSTGTRNAMVEVAQYQHDPRRAARLARDVGRDEWRTRWAVPEGWALRDEAIITGDFTPALQRMDERFALTVPWGPAKTSSPREWNRTLGLVYAHTLVLAGETQRGRRLAETILAQLDSESVGRAPHYMSRDRAAALTILGDTDRALAELKNALSIGHYYSWWYLSDLDPLYEPLRSDPRFQALAKQAKDHRKQQRALLEQMRSSGEVPRRG